MNKMGYNKSGNAENMVLAIIGIGLMFFIFNMNDVYQFVSKVKTGEIFEKEKAPVKTEKPKEEVEEKYEIVTPVGEAYGTCTKTTNETNGDLNHVVKLYHTNYKLKSIVEELEYVAVKDEYVNYIYSENNIYKDRQDNNKDLKGYSIVPTLSNANVLKVSSIINLSLVSLDKIKINENESMNIVGKYDQDTVELTEEYINLGYECEW